MNLFYKMAPPNVKETESSSKGPATHWLDAWIVILLALFRDQYFHLRRGNAKDSHWDKLTASFNAEAGSQLTKQTIKNKIDNLKKKIQKRTCRGCQNFRGDTFNLGLVRRM